MQPQTLARGRIVLSAPTAADVDRITELCQDPDIQRWTTIPVPYARQDAVGFLTAMVEPGWATGSPVWAVRIRPADRADAEPVLQGMISLTDRGNRLWEIGYWMAAEARGTGAMTTAVELALDFARDQLGAAAVRWKCLVLDGEPNWASWRIAWKVGFRLDGPVRAGCVQRGELRDGWVATWLVGEPRTPVAAWQGPVRGAYARPAMPDPRDPDALVRQFHHTYAMPIQDTPEVDRERLGLRMGLVAEEFAELVGAVYGDAAEAEILAAYERLGDARTRDTVATADALGDLVYVAYGMALECGIPLPEVLGEIQASNLSKLGADGRPIYRADGKVLKGPGFVEPDIAGVLRRHRP
ncbi:GNAT family N-acetyltransferase [Granulicoccus phenolivorans]|uniref:GNAT family N-acetyltransferase n=1 Tax=Granulicoccus phenolivorans TaxID=266854 RepID=UPI0004181A40|nr:GNAT family N-acetyltransferase [Granulicoccus phenolivorans]